MKVIAIVACFFSLGLLAENMPSFEIMTGKAAEEKLRLLFDGAVTQNPFVFKGTNHEGKSCTLEFNTPSDSEFIVSLHQAMEMGAAETLVAKVSISKMATLSRATRSFESYFSEHYKLFIPSGGFDILEHRKRHDHSEYQLLISSSLDQNNWFDCGKFNL
ncbi:MAG: hypothetical protein EB078_01745 [Proteobacteria bacterium]|nr:hypothetical protein [Pseudomonadota bacterium]NDC23434.1 hypothetical protein [Pseudomonadota bacterium]NDD03604.1 hypothetical protein [Pseudomonadota bacterium]NDG25977.1 hypothetical protein [Pseudomonadota bacterium]